MCGNSTFSHVVINLNLPLMPNECFQPTLKHIPPLSRDAGSVFLLTLWTHCKCPEPQANTSNLNHLTQAPPLAEGCGLTFWISLARIWAGSGKIRRVNHTTWCAFTYHFSRFACPFWLMLSTQGDEPINSHQLSALTSTSTSTICIDVNPHQHQLYASMLTIHIDVNA